MSNEARMMIRCVSSGTAYDEAQLRLEFARKVANYLGQTESSPAGDVIAGMAGAIEALIGDAEALLGQHEDEKRQAKEAAA